MHEIFILSCVLTAQGMKAGEGHALQEGMRPMQGLLHFHSALRYRVRLIFKRASLLQSHHNHIWQHY